MLKIVFVIALLASGAWAQNPVSDALRNMLTLRAKNTLAAAQQMPADRYDFQPTAAQVPFRHWVSHAAQANYLLCSRLTDANTPDASIKETDPKDKLVTALKQSFDFCSAQLPKLEDRQLANEITLFRDRKATKGEAVLELSADWADHYAQMASYLRLNGLLPPTARK
jgi:hypothetical protein